MRSAYFEVSEMTFRVIYQSVIRMIGGIEYYCKREGMVLLATGAYLTGSITSMPQAANSVFLDITHHGRPSPRHGLSQ